ncbi:iron-containing alcohol dehydrogenase [Thermosediminibacter litoriperuensis]|uniref:Alcohol dehydrogenase n=1 Tax=Thermosediminibacter litoriperuensis TaxID=291989 RepID=A0A5S5ACT2_9FIRM|nr:iron-containing alcohol dehydrogenase [Thermosediminibacter litoriperuensis]TYP47007.1 alcohol dehydrogenase [Thermosediminibacter litoriperuensis]
MDFQFFVPSRIIFGRGKVKEAGFYAKGLGKRALVVTGKSSARKAGSLERLTKSLEENGVQWVLFDGVEPNPLTTTVDRGADLARENKVDLVIGLGGGSAMDTAKGIAFAAVNDGPIADYMEGRSGERALPLILIPTTSGTGSEANNIAVMTNPVTMVKKGFRNPSIFAKVSIVDPDLTATMPREVTASTGIDAFFHALESFLSLRSQPFTEILSLKAMELIYRNLIKACADGADPDSREAMALASTMAGMAIGHSGVCVLHAMEHPLSSFYGASHGEGMAPIAGAFLRFVKPRTVERLARAAKAMGLDTEGLSAEEAAQKAVTAIEEMIKELGLPDSISLFGVKEEDIEKLAQHVYNYMGHNLKTTPGSPAYEDIRQMYRESL